MDSAPAIKKGKSMSPVIPWVLRPGNAVLVFMQEQFNKIFTPLLNPFYFLGAITFFFCWILFITGAYLLLYYNMDPKGSYESIQYLTLDQRYVGGIMRSLHRYATDGLMIVILFHVLQVLFSDRFRSHRWLAWVTGVIILPITWFAGFTGYFLVWDDKAQMIATETSHIFDILPISSEPLSRAFLVNDTLNPVFFFFLNFGHIALPTLLLILGWVHVMRVTRPLISPPWALGMPIMVLLLAISLIKPALSGQPADLSKLVGTIDIDWFYMAPYPVINVFNLDATTVWFLFGGFYFIFVLLPWLVPGHRASDDADAGAGSVISGIDDIGMDAADLIAQRLEETSAQKVPRGVAKVTLKDCKACDLCLEVCPFEAISIDPRSDDMPYSTEATINPSLCGECGFCVTACEFDAIEMDGWTKSTFLGHIEALFSATNGSKPKVMAFVCERSIDMDSIIDKEKKRLIGMDDVAVMILPCIGVISPALVEYSLKAGATGIVAVGGRALDCHFRAARRRIQAGMEGDPSPFYVERMNQDNIKVFLISRFKGEELLRDIKAFVAETAIDKKEEV